MLLKMFYWVCDGPGENGQLCDSEFGPESAPGRLRQAAEKSGWVRQNEKHYCPECVQASVLHV